MYGRQQLKTVTETANSVETYGENIAGYDEDRNTLKRMKAQAKVTDVTLRRKLQKWKYRSLDQNRRQMHKNVRVMETKRCSDRKKDKIILYVMDESDTEQT